MGDPIAPAVGDHYSAALEPPAPELFHQPVNTAFEFDTAHDSGRLLANVCEEGIGADFWRQVYNIGGGEGCRVGYKDYLDRVFSRLGLRSSAELFERSWFALKNFHCHWSLDSDVLEGHLHFRRDGLSEDLDQVASQAPLVSQGRARAARPGQLDSASADETNRQ